MRFMNKLSMLIKENDYEYITPKIAKESGISKFEFYKYIHDNELEAVSRGIYLTGNNWIDELYILHQRCPHTKTILLSKAEY